MLLVEKISIHVSAQVFLNHRWQSGAKEYVIDFVWNAVDAVKSLGFSDWFFY